MKDEYKRRSEEFLREIVLPFIEKLRKLCDEL
jgi:hypothetical protein